MSVHKKILILYSNVGGGHYSISKVLKTIIEDNNPSSEVRLENIIPSFTPQLYRISTTLIPRIYLKIWRLTDNETVSKLLHFLGFFLITPKLKTIVDEFNPDLIISTSGSSTYEVKKALKTYVPHVVVIADPFTIHSGWVTYKNADLYIAPTKESFDLLTKAGIGKDKISLTGWPIRKEFYSTHPQKEIVNSLSLSPKKLTVFVGGSGEGQGNIYQIVQKITKDLTLREKLQLIVVCGNNLELQNKLNKIARKHPNLLRVYGFAEEIHKFMCVADMIVGKPGPNLLFESILLQKPFLATGYPIGQEVGNYSHIQNSKIGKVCPRPSDVLDEIKNIKNNPKILKMYSENLKLEKRQHFHTHKNIWKAIKPFIL